MTQGPQWARLPAELRARPQWCVAGPDKAPLGIDAAGNTYNASVTDPRTWLPFEAAASYAYAHNLFIGYVISEDDPFACIDYDVCDEASQARKGKPRDPSLWTTGEQKQIYWNSVQHINSYTETSTFGQGLHTWVYGSIGHGLKKNGVEVYSQQRFIISTGNVLAGYDTIQDRSELLLAMVAGMRPDQKLKDLVELDEDEDDRAESDEVIHERAINAANGAKYNELICGRWEAMGFPSQSEADLALMSMYTFYSPFNSQCRRLFRYSALGRRAKAVKNDKYLNYTLRLIRGRQEREKRALDGQLESVREYAQQQSLQREQQQQVALHVPGHEPAVNAPPAPIAFAEATAQPPPREEGLPWPPGLAGHLAYYIYQSAPRPVAEVAIVAALGFLAGLCGKAFSIPQSGLNIYVILVARSAIGKEAMHSGISGIIKAVAMRAPAVHLYVNFNDMVSGQALTKACVANPSFVNVSGEWGRKLKRIAADDGREGPMSSLRTVMTNLYQKSGPAAIVGGMQYSNNEKDVQSVSGVAYSMIGETTPGTFYECLTESMMEDGFLSRFTIVEYNGERPAANKNPNIVPPTYLADGVADLVQRVSGLLGRNGTAPVNRTEEAARMMAEFEAECDGQINSTNDEAWRQMWNRASLKTLRIAALLAVGADWMNPVINMEHMNWALDLIRRDIKIMRARIASGDVGSGDHARERKVVALIRQYLKDGAPDGYAVPPAMRADGVIPRKYLQMRTARISTFSSQKIGATAALDQILRSMVDNGYLMEVPRDKLKTGYEFNGRCYGVLSLPSDNADRK